jgi:hypothetical protein
MSRIWVPRYVTRLVVDYFTYVVRSGASAVAQLVIDHAPSRRSTSRRSVAPALDVCPVIPLCVVTTRLAVATDILRLRYASGCLSTSRGSSSTTSTTLRVRVPRHVARLVKWLVARLVVDYIDYAARPGASARRAARRRLLLLCCAIGCLGTSRGSSSTTSPMLCDRVPRHVARLVVDHAPSHRSTSRRSVALALAVRPVNASRDATTRRSGLHRL